GASMAKKFSEEGIETLILTDIQPDELEKTANEIERNYKVNVLTMIMDVSKEEEWIKVVKIMKKKLTRLDILVNNAGITHRVNFVDCSIEDWNSVIAVNQTGTFLGMKHCAPFMKLSKGGSIINLSSIAGLTGYFASAYTASKWAVRGMSKAAAMEFGEWGIRVNSIHPGFIWTPLTEAASDMVNQFSNVSALERVGIPEEIANAAAFLASDESSYMTGSELAIDAGLTAGGGVRMIAKELDLL